ncbi:MAG: hypothetical protein HYT73_02860 [Candidatus Aenigmarchaeota archaeon]|nr:hypothetical protein [Candidatus Aenigmarchaeota archaeon]
MRLIEVLKIRKYLLLAAASSIAMSLFYVYTQVLGIIENIDIWLAVLPWHNAILFPMFSALFGMTLAYQVYLWKQPKTCAVGMKAAGIGAGSGGTFGLSMVSQCPACASLGALFLPASLTAAFAQFSWVINLAAILMMLFTLRYLGAFKND